MKPTSRPIDLPTTGDLKKGNTFNFSPMKNKFGCESWGGLKYTAVFIMLSCPTDKY